MVSIEMERWRIFFEKSGEDLWTVIDWALTIAAVNFPQELRVRRDGYAEKLFAPSHYPLVSRAAAAAAAAAAAPAAPFTELRSAPESVKVESDHGGNCGYEDGEDRIGEDLNPDDDGSSDEQIKIRQQIVNIGHSLENLDDTSGEEEFLRPLERLEQMKISVDDMKVTLIGKVVNSLRKHPSKRVKNAAKRLVRLWKDVADEWAKTSNGDLGDDGQNEEGELMEDQSMKMHEPGYHRMELLSSSVSSVTQPNVGFGDDDMFGCSPDDGRTDIPRNMSLANLPSERSNSRLNGYRRDAPALSQPRMDYNPGSSSANRLSTRVPPSFSKKPPPTRAAQRPQSPECDRLEAVKKKLHEGYQQAANVKRQRTVQVMGLEEVPQERPPGANAGTRTGAGGSSSNSRRGGLGR